MPEKGPHEAQPSANTHGAVLLENFLDYPAPLALLDEDGRMEMVNTSFSRQFGDVGVSVAWLERLGGDGHGPRPFMDVPLLHPSGVQVRARAVRMPRNILLVVDENDIPDRDRELDELRRQLAELVRLASTDHLTGAWNRGHLDRVIEVEVARSAASRQPITLILFDVDHFKSINDRFGHALGDHVLRELAQVVRRNLRAADMLFRWGGEEFVVLMSAAGYRSAERVAEKLRVSVANHLFEAGAVTISLGVAERDLDESTKAWFERLDGAMYEAKRAGRNRVAVDRRGASDAWTAERAGSALHLSWQEGYECGDPVIDEEHRELFRLANELIDASLHEPSKETISAALGDFIAHVQQHFIDEEQILERLRYPELEAHRRAHAGLVHRALQMKQDVARDQVSVGAIVEFLAEDVVARHLLGVDRAFFPLVARG